MANIGPKAGRWQLLVPLLALAGLGGLAALGGLGACATTTETAQLHIVPAVVLDSGPMAIESEDASASAFALAARGDGGRCANPDEVSRGTPRKFTEKFVQGSGLATLHFPQTFSPNSS